VDDQHPLFDLPGDDDLPPEFLVGMRTYLRFIRARRLRGSFLPRLNISDGRILDWKFELEEVGRTNGRTT
jgi:hypothetical protein